MRPVSDVLTNPLEPKRTSWSDFWLGLTVLTAAGTAGALMIRLFL
jgi:hypothetical protein